MQNEKFDELKIREFAGFIQNINFKKSDNVDIYAELVKQLILKSCCAN